MSHPLILAVFAAGFIVSGHGAASAVDDCVPDCREGYFCMRGQCISRCNPRCESDQRCTDRGQCVLQTPATGEVPVPPDASTTDAPAAIDDGVLRDDECIDDLDCPSGFGCDHGYCREAARRVRARDECRSDRHCHRFQRCWRGACQNDPDKLDALEEGGVKRLIGGAITLGIGTVAMAVGVGVSLSGAVDPDMTVPVTVLGSLGIAAMTAGGITMIVGGAHVGNANRMKNELRPALWVDPDAEGGGAMLSGRF